MASPNENDRHPYQRQNSMSLRRYGLYMIPTTKLTYFFMVHNLRFSDQNVFWWAGFFYVLPNWWQGEGVAHCTFRIVVFCFVSCGQKKFSSFSENRSRARKRISPVCYPIGTLQPIPWKCFCSKFWKTGRRSAGLIKRLVVASPAFTTTVGTTTVVELLCVVQCIIEGTIRHH